MNNMVFPISLYLLDNGYDVTLFYLDEYEHFKPDPRLIPPELTIVELGWNEKNYPLISKNDIIETFKGYSFFLGIDYSAGFLAKAGIRMDIYMPAGSDLFHYPFKTFNSMLPETWEIAKVKCARNQLFGIKHAKYISMDFTNQSLVDLLEQIKCKAKRTPVLPFVYFKSGKLFKLESKSKATYDQRTFRIIQQSRQSWKYDRSNPHHKGNDTLIQGFAKFAQQRPNAKLLLLEYGENVKESKELITSLGIEEYVDWIPKTHKDEIFSLIESANICVGNLNESYLSYGSVYEALACKVAFMGYRRDEHYKDDYPELYPMINASDIDEVAQQLEYYYHHQDKLVEMGEKSHQWLIDYAINPSVHSILNIALAHKGRSSLPLDIKLFLMQPYFLFIKFYNFFRIRLSKWIRI